jgi:hypothetical protein
VPTSATVSDRSASTFQQVRPLRPHRHQALLSPSETGSCRGLPGGRPCSQGIWAGVRCGPFKRFESFSQPAAQVQATLANAVAEVHDQVGSTPLQRPETRQCVLVLEERRGQAPPRSETASIDLLNALRGSWKSFAQIPRFSLEPRQVLLTGAISEPSMRMAAGYGRLPALKHAPGPGAPLPMDASCAPDAGGLRPAGDA